MEWFIESGLPEGYYTAAFQAASMNNLILLSPHCVLTAIVASSNVINSSGSIKFAEGGSGQPQ